MKQRDPFDCSTLFNLGLTALGLLLSGCHEAKPGIYHEEGSEKAKLVVSRPLKKDVVVGRDFVCQIRSSKNIEIRALERGYLEMVAVQEGQRVEQGDLLFKIQPLVYQAELQRAEAEAQVARVEYDNTKRLTEKKVVSDTELTITKAKLEKALADVNLAQTHLGFTELRAPFPGLVDRLRMRNGSLISEGDLLTTLSDNSEMWVYFNVPERDYLAYVSESQPEERKVVELIMANGEGFNHPGRINAIEAEFNNETGTIPFRADFPNPEGLLRHGQTGTIRMKKLAKEAVLVPQKATFEVLDHHYIFVLDHDDKIVQQRIHIDESLEDLFLVSGSVTDQDKIVVEGIRQAKGGDQAQYDFVEPEILFKNLKLRAE